MHLNLYRIEIENTLTQQVWYLDKLVDELAKDRKMEEILHSLLDALLATEV